VNNRPECIPCCLRRTIRTAHLVTSDEWLHRKILGEAMQELSRVAELVPPAELAFAVFRRASKVLGVADPYADEKHRWVEEAMGNADRIRAAVDGAPDPFVHALKLSVAANLLDWELRDDIAQGYSLKTLLDEAGDVQLDPDHVEDLRRAAAEASRVFFIHASAGELFFDRLLIERMRKPKDSVVSVVRDSATLAQATREDAEAVGLPQVARVIDPGISCLGILLSASSKGFREEYAQASLVVAKGQAVYETLEGRVAQAEETAKDVFFLLRVKCAVMARQLGAAVGDCVVEPM
jgi:hypothetical protein